MADEYLSHYDDRYGERQRRSFTERAGDEVRSWFGDDEAQARRDRDDRESEQYGWDRNRGWRYPGEGDDDQSWRRERNLEGSSYGSWAGRGERFGSTPASARGATEGSYGYDVGGRWRELDAYEAGFGSAGYGYPRPWDEQRGRGLRPAGGSSLVESWRGTGGHRGKGPRDYRRSDERIREDVSDRLTDDHDVDASEITVNVQGGEVTLTGTVTSRDQKRRAEDLAERIGGVTEVINNLRVATSMQEHGRQTGELSILSGTGTSHIGETPARTRTTSSGS